MTNEQFLEVIKSTVGTAPWQISDSDISCTFEDKYEIIIKKECTDWLDIYKTHIKDIQSNYYFTLDGNEIQEAYEYIRDNIQRQFEDKFYNYLKTYPRKKKFQTLKDNEEDD